MSFPLLIKSVSTVFSLAEVFNEMFLRVINEIHRADLLKKEGKCPPKTNMRN